MSIPALFFLSFVLGLTGAMSPGPFLSYAIAESARRGRRVGPQLVAGHALPELAIMLLITLGLGGLLARKPILAVISFVGGVLLIYMGIGALRGLKGYTLGAASAPKGARLHPTLSGIILSLSNPYWFIWWFSVAIGYVMLAKSLGLTALIAFFAGHISADLAWYTFVSFGTHFGGRRAGTKILKVVLLVCNLFLIFFGAYFLINGFRLL
jgi:threonine/homoserine/homoserine lactone efflux protein